MGKGYIYAGHEPYLWVLEASSDHEELYYDEKIQ